MRWSGAVTVALVLASASGAGAQAPQSSRAGAAADELSTDWGAWPVIEIGETLAETRAVVQEAVGVALTPTPDSPGNLLRVYEARYTRGTVKMVERIDVLKSSGRVAGYSLRLSTPLPCEGLMAELTDALGPPEPERQGAVGFGPAGPDPLIWTDTDNDQLIRVELQSEGPPRRCRGNSATPYKRTYR